MTNEEAIEIIKAYKDRLTSSCSNQLDNDIEAFNLAIKALETGEVYMTGEDYNLYIEGYKAGKKDFEPKQGEWIANSLGDYVCNKCSWVVGKFERNFCPNCGAKMQKEGDCTSIVCGDCVLGNCDSCEDLRGDTE